jgi:hypothetical protein
MGDERNAYSLGWKFIKRPSERLISRWEDNIKMDFTDKRLGGMGWIDLAQDRDEWMALVQTPMLSVSIKRWEILQ